MLRTMSTHIRPIKLTNSLTRKKETLETLEPGKLRMYSCGPTVYGLIHIGNLRAGLSSDMFFRYFKRAGYDVTYVRNYTDIDDKIINQAVKEGMTPEQLARKYTQEVEKDYAVAGMLEPTHKTKVVDHIPEIIGMIQKIIANGKAYVAPDGEVLFSIRDFESYGKLSGKSIDDLEAGARVEVSSKKRDPLDFALWKPAKPGEPSWDSPWGKGRPGWHIECSAMSSKWLGDQIDVHHGGEDLTFPHHENEIAQSEAACGRAPFVRYWLHHSMLNMGKDKMSKSLGNILTARDFLTRYGGEVARYFLLSVHYRSPIEFSDETLEHTLQSLQRIYEAKAKAQEIQKQARARADLRAEGMWGEFLATVEKVRLKIEDCYANDFNTAGALGELFTLIREFNRVLSEPLAAATPAAVLGATEFVRTLEDEIGSVIGIGRLDPKKALEDLEKIRAARPAAGGAAKPQAGEIEKLIQARLDARKEKNFARADEIRKDLDARGVVLKDSPQGTTWSYK